ncbi:MAG TPA: hypothetical protein PLM50_02395 [Rectinema sp.]|nr:hypothetical protein [Rectinema sp.]
MCKFFSFVGDGYGNYLYADWNLRKTRLRANWDSHTTILTHFKVPPKMQDRWSKYEYNPFTKEFTVDQGIERHDHEAAENWVRHLNFKSVVEPLVIKKIRNPLTGKAKNVSEQEIALLDQWIKVWNSVEASVWDSVWDSVGLPVWDSVRDSVWGSVRDSVWKSFIATVWASVWAYSSSFFKIKYEHDFSSAVKLWNSGFVPSFDGETWRLHSGKNAEIVYERRVK